MIEKVFRHLYQVSKGTRQLSEDEPSLTSLLPMPVGMYKIAILSPENQYYLINKKIK